MKVFICFLLFTLSSISPAAAQEKNAIGYSERGILLNSGWKFQPGDDPAWALPHFDDGQWQAVNPTTDIHDLPQLRKAEIGWFRLQLKIDSTLLNKPMALLIKQMGASEFYLNGRRILRLGNLSKDHKKEVVFNPNNNPYAFQFTGGTDQVLAVRYSFTKRNFYLNNQMPGNNALVIQVQSADGAFKMLIHEKSHYSFLHFAKVGFLLLLFLIHLFFYIYYPESRTNLYYSLFALCWMFTYWLMYAINKMPREGDSSIIMNLLMMLLAMPGLLLALTAVYSHARQPKGAMYGFVFLCLLLTYPTARWPYYWGWLMVYVCLTAAVADAIRVCVLAKRRRIAGAGIILIGWIVFFFSTGFSLLMILGAIKLTDLGPNYSHILDLTYNAGFLFLWLPFSIILAREFAKTNRSLQHRLKEVEALSAKTVEQEKEKQQILADQNIKLEQQVEQRTTELKHSLQELKATQTQLIQSEKMASLGELTAGIAHEIQNPLNFVNNFSEINADLIDEMKETLQSGNTNDALSVAEEIKENNLKITSHGKRADAIVKGMLQHSRTSTGQKEHTDINTLMDEYLRLSYHGFRAKDKSFNASIQTHFDESLGKINLVPQEIGRVLLNLFNNAFYAVQEKKKTSGEGYEPMVYVSTKRHMDKVEISVQDNGMGILKSVQDKIFQPFFTTKPTGEGTGLGLSLSYDIVKAHGGELKVESTEGEGSEFIVILYQDLS